MPNAISNFFVTALVGSPLHGLLGPGLAVITVQGRKTGRAISTPINVVADGEGYTVTSLRSRTWWRNLRGGAPANLRVAGQQLRVCGDVLESDDAVRAGLARYFREHPNLARYYGLPLGPDGSAPPKSLEHLAQDRVIIHLRRMKGA